LSWRELISPTCLLYAVDEQTGAVQVNWKLAEDIVATKSDRIILPMRNRCSQSDRKWKPMH
jgi:hypothetical protein